MEEPNTEETIEATGSDDALTDADSGFSDTVSSTASLRSSIFDYETEYGRSYHAFRSGKYVMPNDEGEQDRMDMHYHAIRIAFGNRLYFAPLERPMSVLDVGTGTGIWAMDFADDHPPAHVIGVDLSPIQVRGPNIDLSILLRYPLEKSYDDGQRKYVEPGQTADYMFSQPTAVPPNLEFEIMDADEPWDFGTARFDFVHTRLMNGFSIKSWPFFYAQAYSSLRPGGWAENQEFDLKFWCDDGTLPEDGAMIQWCNLWNEGIEKMGLTGRCDPNRMKAQMEVAGFTNIEIRFCRVPIGSWPKDKRLRQSGTLSLVGLTEGLSGLSQRVFTRGLDWSVEEMEVLLARVRNELKDRRIHAYWPIYIVYGQKPLTATT